MKTRFSLSIFTIVVIVLINFTNSYAQTDTTYSVTGAGTADVNGVYINKGFATDGTHYYYLKISGTSATNYIYFDGTFWAMYYNLYDASNDYYYWNFTYDVSNASLPKGGPNGWSYVSASGVSPSPVTSKNTKANMTFTNGSGFTPSSPTLPATNNPIGRFQLLGSSVGGVLQSVTVSLSGTRTGASNIKLWSSSSSTFNSSTATSLVTVGTDASSVTFSGFNSLVDNSTGTYYFVTVNLSSSATGSITPTIPSQASFTFVGANSPSSFTSAPLSSAAAPLPVELTNFSAQSSGASVILNWQTATEVNNYGFNVERRTQNSEWQTLGFVNGSGNSNSTKEYSFTDQPTGGTEFLYRLKQIDFDGAFKYSNTINVSIQITNTAQLEQNFPNPFNPTTTIEFTVPRTETIIQNVSTQLKIYDVLGRVAATLVDEKKTPGNYKINFNAGVLSSGIYFYKLITGGKILVKKMILTK